MKLIFGFIVLLGMSVSSASVKFGYVDMDQAVKMTKKGKSAISKLEKITKTKQAELSKKEKALMDKKTALEKQFSLLSNDAKMQKQQEFQGEFMKVQGLLKNSQMELMNKEKELMGPVIEGLRKEMDKLAKKEGYTFILEKNRSGILFADPTVDITAKLVKAYGK